MPLGTLDRSPPPFFRQGPSALARLITYSALGVFLMVLDARWHLAAPLRSAIALALHPVQRALLVPVDAWDAAGDYLRGSQRAEEAELAARTQLVQQAARLARTAEIEAENTRLRALLGLRPALQVESQAAEILYEAPDPFSRRVVIDRGSSQGLTMGAPVVDEQGVLGQVTRVYALSSEVTLLSDKDAQIPLLNTRTQQRSIAVGSADGAGLELRFLPANADVKEGDLLTTSGLDGVYPPGLPVARISLVERRGDTNFARVLAQPVAPPDAVRHVLVLRPVDELDGDRAAAAAAARASAAAAAASAPAPTKRTRKSEKADKGEKSDGKGDGR
ncbi:MAG: rod shape-determining protein MreC [Pelomonas sp.]|nr:rod shape-determining protein MreC [Roseateles sp.]